MSPVQAHPRTTQLVRLDHPRPSLPARLVGALHQLVSFLTSLHFHSVHERYNKEYLVREAGLSSYDLDIIEGRFPAVYRLSREKEMEPALSFLRSLGIAPGRDLAHMLRCCPEVLGISIEVRVWDGEVVGRVHMTFFKVRYGLFGFVCLLQAWQSI